MVVFLVDEFNGCVLEDLVSDDKSSDCSADKNELVESIENYSEAANLVIPELNYSGSVVCGGEIKNYHYDEIKDLKVTPRGDSYDEMLVSFESEVFDSAQKYVEEQKNAECSNQAYLCFDLRKKDAKYAVSTMNPALWQFMYEVSGKVIFN